MWFHRPMTPAHRILQKRFLNAISLPTVGTVVALASCGAPHLELSPTGDVNVLSDEDLVRLAAGEGAWTVDYLVDPSPSDHVTCPSGNFCVVGTREGADGHADKPFDTEIVSQSMEPCLRMLLVKDAAAVERLEKVTTLLVDKTGTLTEGRPHFSQAIPAGDESANTLLQLAASLEQSSEHPLASAVVKAAKDASLPLLPVEAFESTTGGGVSGRINGRLRGVRIGRA